VLHYPPGTSKWNRIEHRFFSHIQVNWRAKPLTSYQVMIDLIATTSTGLEVYARLDDRTYETSIKVSDEQLAAVNIERDEFHGEWNYTIAPTIKYTQPLTRLWLSPGSAPASSGNETRPRL
jgi:hypothetical protein